MKNTITVKKPQAWEHEVRGETVQVLPLVDDLEASYGPGWCTYLMYFPDTPELEFFCGGINSKTATAGALWRLGNLLHFGFDQTPAQLNETGEALLINSIIYIARFTEDRPLTRVPSVFAGGPWTRHRHVIERAMARDDLGRGYLEMFLSEDTFRAIKSQNRKELARHFDERLEYIHPNEQGKLRVDEEARAFGVSPRTPEFLKKAIAALDRPGEEAKGARRLLARYAPEGPGESGSSAAWRKWLAENGPYLFFCDGGWYRWYLDELAKKRGIPSARLRGLARATKPRLQLSESR